jgi:hypothetical protein
MRRPFLLVLLGLGALSGFAAGFSSLRHGGLGFGQRWGAHPFATDALAEACLRAAERAQPPSAAPPVTP